MHCADEGRRISASRRALFPSAEQDDDSDLGHMSPLSATENSNSDSESATDGCYFKSLKNHSADDYDILGNIHKHSEGPLQNEVVSPASSLLSAPILLNDENTIIPDTPVKESPMLKLETPHVTSLQSTVLPKLVRKVQNDEEESPEHKQQKLDGNSAKAKVRTALFPENDLSVPVRSFYAKTDENVRFQPKVFVTKDEVKRKKKTENVYLCSRRTKRNRFGQINTGVRHKIRKPKQKKPTKMQLLKAAINLLENSPLNGYLDELKQLQNKPRSIQPIGEKNEQSRKRERSPDGQSKKFEITLKGHDFSVVRKPSAEKIIETGANVFDGDDDDDAKLIENDCISDLINHLEDDKENSEIVEPLAKRQKLELLSPISQMCDTTSGLALNSPKKARNLTAILENLTHSNSVEMEKPKLFPIFDFKSTNNKRKNDENCTKATTTTTQVKKWKSLPANQMLLDAGQKRFGWTQCSECEIVYHMGDPSEEIMHLNYHNAGNVLKFNVSWFGFFLQRHNGGTYVNQILDINIKVLNF